MTLTKLILTTSLMLAPVLIAGQGQGGLDPASILKPLADSWPTYSGDYTGRRYSALTQINQKTVKNLTLAWVARVTAGPGGAGGFGGFGGRGAVSAALPDRSGSARIDGSGRQDGGRRRVRWQRAVGD